MSEYVTKKLRHGGFRDFEGSAQRLLHNIPSSFELWGQTIKVELDPGMHHNEDINGCADYRLSKIILQPRSEQTPMTEDAQLHTFFHELTHFILYCAGEDNFDPPLHKREYLVDRIAGLLHQAIKSMKWDEDIKEKVNK